MYSALTRHADGHLSAGVSDMRDTLQVCTIHG